MQAIGEVLSSKITSYTAEAWRHQDGLERMAPEHTPFFGSFLKSKSEDKNLTVYGVVYDIVTGPQDQHHKPTALRMTRAELRKEQPQIFSLLKTEWHVAVVAYKQAGRCHCGLPPFPPEVHDFVFPLEPEELLEASENLEFLRMLYGITGVPGDELLAACIRNAAKPRHDDYDYLVEAGQQVSKLLRDDYERLGSVLRKIKP
jgi:hypothetical protein